MSAPRKIWVDEGSLRWLLFNGYVDESLISRAEPYHHDDVVRELVNSLAALVLNIDAGGSTLSSMSDARATLAKIAQEG